jgi:predicted O-methyltransferase YrrM
MNRKENLKEILNKIKDIPTHYFARSLYVDQNEMMMLCNNVIINNVKNVIEIGTYKGVAAAVFSSIIDGNVYTINVDNEEIRLSKILWDSLGIKNIIQIKGSSLDMLSTLINNIDDIGFIYVDGNHDIPYPATEFQIILDSKVKNNKCLVYFDDGPLAGVMQAIQKYNLITLSSGYNWMHEDEKKKNVNATLRAYHVFGDFNMDLGNKI